MVLLFILRRVKTGVPQFFLSLWLKPSGLELLEARILQGVTTGLSLTELNDEGLTFNEIADRLERYWEDYFMKKRKTDGI